MNESERLVKEKYEQQGWNVLEHGAPDFLIYKNGEDGKITEVQFVEVKTTGGARYLEKHQMAWKIAVEAIGIKYTVEKVWKNYLSPAPWYTKKPFGVKMFRNRENEILGVLTMSEKSCKRIYNALEKRGTHSSISTILKYLNILEKENKIVKRTSRGSYHRMYFRLIKDKK